MAKNEQVFLILLKTGLNNIVTPDSALATLFSIVNNYKHGLLWYGVWYGVWYGMVWYGCDCVCAVV